MKQIIFSISLGLLSMNSFATDASEISKACFSKAVSAVEKHVAEDNYYDEDGMETQACAVASNNAAVICEVTAYKGEGEASDTFRVVLNRKCTRTFRVEMTAEE